MVRTYLRIWKRRTVGTYIKYYRRYPRYINITIGIHLLGRDMAGSQCYTAGGTINIGEVWSEKFAKFMRL